MFSILIIISSFLVTIHGQTTFSCNTSAPCGCSARPAVMSRILNGEMAPNETWGWAVSLLLNNTYFCSGTLISSSWVLTSTGCVSSYRPSEVLVSAGTHTIFGGKQGRVASQIIAHPEMNWNTGVNNIALVMVQPPFNMSDPSVSRLCLPSATNEDYPQVNSSVVTIGWGLTSMISGPQTFLRQVTLQRVSSSVASCQAMAANASVQICATGANGSKTICPGDAGGPLMQFTSSQQWVLAGVISHSGGCSNTGYPAVFTRITSYLNWLSSMNVTGTATVSDMSPYSSTTSSNTTISTTTPPLTTSSLVSSVMNSTPTTSVIVSSTAVDTTKNSAYRMNHPFSMGFMAVLIYISLFFTLIT